MHWRHLNGKPSISGRSIECYDLKCISNQNFLYGGEARPENKVLASHSKKNSLSSLNICQYFIINMLQQSWNNYYSMTTIQEFEGSGSQQTTRSHSLEPIRRVAEDAVEGRGRNVHLAAVPGRPPAPRSEPIRPKMYEIFLISKLDIYYK